MKSKPLIFNIYAVLFFIIAISVPAQISLIYGHNIAEMDAIFQKLTIFNIMVIVVSLANFYFCFTSSDNVKWSFPLSIGVICFNNSIVLIYGNDFESYTVILSTVLFIIFSAYFLSTHDTDIMNTPKEQWWRVPKRFSLKEAVSVQIDDKTFDVGETFDISTSGAFIPLTDELKDRLKNGSSYVFSIGKETPIKCKGKVIRKTVAKGNYPGGIGIEFVNLDVSDKFKLQHKIFSSKLGHA